MRLEAGASTAPPRRRGGGDSPAAPPRGGPPSPTTASQPSPPPTRCPPDETLDASDGASETRTSPRRLAKAAPTLSAVGEGGCRPLSAVQSGWQRGAPAARAGADGRAPRVAGVAHYRGGGGSGGGGEGGGGSGQNSRGREGVGGVEDLGWASEVARKTRPGPARPLRCGPGRSARTLGNAGGVHGTYIRGLCAAHGGEIDSLPKAHPKAREPRLPAVARVRATGGRLCGCLIPLQRSAVDKTVDGEGGAHQAARASPSTIAPMT